MPGEHEMTSIWVAERHSITEEAEEINLKALSESRFLGDLCAWLWSMWRNLHAIERALWNHHKSLTRHGILFWDGSRLTNPGSLVSSRVARKLLFSPFIESFFTGKPSLSTTFVASIKFPLIERCKCELLLIECMLLRATTVFQDVVKKPVGTKNAEAWIKWQELGRIRSHDLLLR